MEPPGKRSKLRLLVPSAVGCIAAVTIALIVAGMSSKSTQTFSLIEGSKYEQRMSIGIPTWYDSTQRDGATTQRVHWLNVLVFAGGLYLFAMPLGRLITDAARPMRMGPIVTIVVLTVLLLAVFAGGAISRYYWGYWFSRPALDWRVANARALNRLTPIDNLDVSGTDRFNPGPLIEFRVRGGGDWSDSSRLSGSNDADDYYTLQGRVLNALRAAGHNLAAAPQRSDPEVRGLYALVVGSGWLDPGSPGYNAQATTLTGYAIDLAGPREGQDDLLLLTLTSGQVSNDHFGYYELLFGPPVASRDETTRPLIAANLFYYDVAGIEGMEWYVFAMAFGLLGVAITLPLTVVTLVILGTRRRNTLIRRGFAVEPICAALQSKP